MARPRGRANRDSLNEPQQLTADPHYRVPNPLIHAYELVVCSAFCHLVPDPISHHHGRYSLVLRPAVVEYPTLPLWHVHVQAPLVKFVGG